MSDQHSRKFAEAVREIAEKVRKYREQYHERRLGEEGTKAALISPLMKALGWNIEDPDEVTYEFRQTPSDNPVDYCLRLMRETRLLIEAKALGEELCDWRWIIQILGYATAVGVQWCVLTDGDEYQIFNTSAPVPAEQRLLCKVKLSDEGREEEAIKVLSLISRSNMSGPMLEELWQRYHTDHRVKDALRELMDTPDHRLVLLIRKRICESEIRLSTKAVAASIRRLDIRIEALAAPYEIKLPLSKDAGRKGDRGKRHNLGVTLAKLLVAGYLSAPLALFRQFRGRRLEATLLPDGKVEFDGKVYESGSLAASVAHGTVTEGKMGANGWTFWQYQGNQGLTLCLDDARHRYLKDKVSAKDLTEKEIQQCDTEAHEAIDRPKERRTDG